MDLVSLLGWAAMVAGSVVGIPQVWRILRTRSVDGISLWTWQTLLAVNIGWGTHGVLINAVNLLVVNLFAITCTLAVLVLMARSLRRSVLMVLLPGTLMGLAMVAIDLWIGSAAFGVVAIVPGVWGLLGQARALVTAPSVKGLSLFFIALTFINFVLWGSWGALVGDPGTLITNILTSAVSGFNLFWLLVRMRRSVTQPDPTDSRNGGDSDVVEAPA